MSDRKLPVLPSRLISIAKKWGTPVYVYDEQHIRERCRKLIGLFPDLPVKWLYAVKANDNPHILKIIQEEGFGFDTVSYEEVLLCLKLGNRPEDVFYTENNMSDEEMDKAVRQKIVLNIGSLYRLELFCRLNPGSACCIRVKPDISEGHHAKVDTGNEDSKFGIRIDHLDKAIDLARRYDVKIRGIHAHIGSGIKDHENLLAEIDVMLKISSKFNKLDFINFGGGIPIPYKPDEKEFEWDIFSEQARKKMNEYLKKSERKVIFYFEPGRWIVGSSGTLITQVTTVKDQGNKQFLGTDTGFNHLLRPILYDAWHEIINISSPKSKNEEHYDIAGNICESGDIFAFNRPMKKTKPGDYMAILDAGAYGMTMASCYNRRSLPAEVLVTSTGACKTIKKRKSPEQTVDDFLKESDLLT